MHFQGFSALSAIALLTSASLSGATHHQNHQQVHQRSVAGSVPVQKADLQALSSQSKTFQDWMNDWFDKANAQNSATYIPKLKGEIKTFDSFMTTFLSTALKTGPSNVHVRGVKRYLSAGSTDIPKGELQMLQSEYSSFQAWVQSWYGYTNDQDFDFTKSLLKQEIEAIENYITTFLAAESTEPVSAISQPPTTASIGLPSIVPSGAGNSAAPYPISGGASGFSTSIIPTGSPAQSPVATSSPAASGPSSPAPTGGAGKGKMAVYYGQTFPGQFLSLADMCADDSVETVILAFVGKFIGAGGYPEIDFTKACTGGPSSAMTAKGATGLKSCPQLGKDIKTCQDSGKKILLSLGGETATESFTNDDEANSFAKNLNNLFGAGTGEAQEMRPFGEAELDGFDIDWEQNGKTQYWGTFVKTLRSEMAGKGLITAAPQCSTLKNSLSSLDDATTQALDILFIQNYNNGDCNVGGTSFVDNIKQWSSAYPKQQIFLGAPGCKACAGSGYLESNALAAQVKSVSALKLSNFGGVMLWDGPAAKANTDQGDFLQIVNAAIA